MHHWSWTHLSGQVRSVYMKDTNCYQISHGPINSIQCDAIITRSIFSQIPIKSPDSSPVTLRYGVSLVDSNTDLYLTSIAAVLYVISCYTGPCYNGTPLNHDCCGGQYFSDWKGNCINISILPSVHACISIPFQYSDHISMYRIHILY